MTSFKSYGAGISARSGAAAGVSVLPTVREMNSEEGEGLNYCSKSATSVQSSMDGEGASGAVYPVDLLGVSWGSYLYSAPPTQGEERETAFIRKAPDLADKMKTGLTTPEQSPPHHPSGEKKGGAEGGGEPHPLMQHLEELMNAVVRSREQLIKCGVDVTPLTPISDLSLASHYNVLQMTIKSKKGQKEQALLTGMLENVAKYVTEVLSKVVEQGKKTNKHASFLQHTARKLYENQQKSLNEQKSIQETIRDSRAKLELERQGLEKEKAALLAAKVELKRMLHKAEVSLSEGERTKRMSSPHTIAQGQGRLTALLKTQKQQSSLEKTLTKQMRDIRSLQQAHDQTRSELLATQEHAVTLQHRLVKQMNEIKSSEAAMSDKFDVTGDTQAYPSLALDKEKRKTYHGASRAQVTATLRGIATAHRTLRRDIERMQRQLSEQHRTGHRVSRQLDESQQELLGTGSRLRQHTATLKGGRQDDTADYRRPKQIEDEKLPKIASKLSISKGRTSRDHLSLPQIQPPGCMTVPSMHTQKIKRLRPQPAYRFSKSELYTLANFDDHKSAEQVMEWLQTQGILLE